MGTPFRAASDRPMIQRPAREIGLQKNPLRPTTIAAMTHTKLIVREPVAGSFFWVLIESDANGDPVRELETAEADFDSYEAALAAGTRALKRLVDREHAAH
jgi:hypothetical protein